MVDFMENPGGPAIPILSYGNIEGQWPLLCLDREEGGRRELKANYKRLCPSSSSRGRLPPSLRLEMGRMQTGIKTTAIVLFVLPLVLF